jgi:hypothetical protein
VSIEQRAHESAYAQGCGEEVRVAREESGLLAEPEESAGIFKADETNDIEV